MGIRRSHWQAAAALLGCLVLAGSGAASAFAAEPLEYLSSFGPDGTAQSDFEPIGEGIGSVAVDQQTGDVYVLDAFSGSLYKFDDGGQPVDFGGTAAYISGNRISGLSPGTNRNESQVFVDPASHVVYVTEVHALRAFQQNGEPANFTAGPGAGTNEISGFGELLGVAVDADGAIYTSDYSGTVAIYSPSGEPLASFSTPEPANLAVASDGSVYVVPYSGLTYSEFTPDPFPVTAATNYTAGAPRSPIGGFLATAIAVDSAAGHVYLLETNLSTSSRIGEYDESGAFVGFIGAPGEPGELGDFAQGVAVVTGGERLYTGNNETADPDAKTSQVEIFGFYEGKPKIDSVLAIGVAAESATLRAQINPGSSETTYRFEYGLADCAVAVCTSVPLGGAAIGDGHRAVSVEQAVGDLEAQTTYHYRLVAENSVDVTKSVDHIFTTQPAGLGFELGDGRAWEMVSPSDKHGALLVGATSDHIQAAAGGNGLVYASRGSIEADPGGSRAVEGSTVLSRRTEDGWLSKDISVPNGHVSPLPIGSQDPYKLFSPDLSKAILEPRTDTPLSPVATEATPYLRTNTQPPSYTPLVTTANAPTGTEFGRKVGLAAASTDLSHLALRSKVPLAEGAPPAPAESLYLWTGGQLRPVSVLPPEEGGSIVAASLIGSGPGSVRHAISADGTRVFWSNGELNNFGVSTITALYLRDMVDEETVRLDVAQTGVSGAGEPQPIFQGANADGTVVFFTDSQQLTEDASPSGRDLYRCEISASSGPPGCSSLIDLTAPIAEPGESGDVQGIVSGMSDDGSTIYFVARAVLDTAANRAGESATAGRANLYGWREGEGVRFVASLSAEDENSWGGIRGLTFNLSAAASPSGRYLSFMSQINLTGKDNLDAGSGEPVEQIFRYDAVTERLDCASCNPTGAAPGNEVSQSFSLIDPQRIWAGRRIAAILPEPTVVQQESLSFYSPRAVLDNGRVFFNALDSLAPADSNNEWDVYQYESAGVGDCTELSGGAASSKAEGGCVSLMSSGTGEGKAAFLDASEVGDDVFFLTRAKLNGTDQDSEYDAYDARVNGIPATLPHPAECLGEGCQSLSVMPGGSTAASEAFKGHGNVKIGKKICPKGKRKVRRDGKTRCIPRKHHKHKKHHKRARTEREVRR
jgi:hypothetical protein